jgi:hypothetical protein
MMWPRNRSATSIGDAAGRLAVSAALRVRRLTAGAAPWPHHARMTTRALSVRAGALLACALAVTACSDDHPGSDGGDAADLASVHGDGGGGSDDLAMPRGPSTFVRRGYVNAINGSTSSSLTAAFYDFGSGHCTLTPFGSCEVFVCDSAAAAIDAGSITVGGAAQTETLAYDGALYHATPALPSGAYAWPAGTAIPVAAAGGTVAAFTATTTMPTALTAISAPVLAAGSATVIPRDQDLTVAWSGGSQSVFVALQAADRVRGPIAQCELPAAAGSGVMPKAALALLPPGTYTFEVLAADVRTVPVPDTFLHVAAGSLGTQSGVTSYNTQITLQ